MAASLPAPYISHLVDPVGFGDLDDANAIGQAGSMIGGMGVRVSFNFEGGIEPDGVIEQVGGVVVGGVGARAPLSIALFSLRHAPSSAAVRIRAQDLLSLLRGTEHDHVFPAAVVRGATMVVEAIRRAVGASDEDGPGDADGRGLLVCRCIGIGDKTIRAAVHAGARTPEAIADKAGAYRGCRSCRPELLQLIHETWSPQSRRPMRIGRTDERDGIARIVKAIAVPHARALGQEVRFVAHRDRVVEIATRPLVSRPDASPIGIRAIVRGMLRDLVSDDIEVTLSTG